MNRSVELPILITAAKQAARMAYAPYSRFTVGAALLAENGEVFCGCNVENASYGLTNCAERVAIGAAVVAGHQRFSAMVIYTPTPQPTAPCGACRQVLREFGNHIAVISICDSSDTLETTVEQLLPVAFGPEHLPREPQDKTAN